MDDSRVPFAYGQRNSQWEWLAYDDVQSMTEKVGSPRQAMGNIGRRTEMQAGRQIDRHPTDNHIDMKTQRQMDCQRNSHTEEYTIRHDKTDLQRSNPVFCLSSQVASYLFCYLRVYLYVFSRLRTSWSKVWPAPCSGL